MSAEILRRAAALMRERAEAADASGVWEVGSRYQRADDWIRPVYDDDGTVCEIHEGTAADAPESCAGLAGHIASWHPAVALAVADWLEYDGHPANCRDQRMALAVARTYLGEQA